MWKKVCEYEFKEAVKNTAFHSYRDAVSGDKYFVDYFNGGTIGRIIDVADGFEYELYSE